MFVDAANGCTLTCYTLHVHGTSTYRYLFSTWLHVLSPFCSAWWHDGQALPNALFYVCRQATSCIVPSDIRCFSVSICWHVPLASRYYIDMLLFTLAL